MIARSWRGRTTIANQNAYIDHFRTNVLPELREIDGFVGATLLKEESSGEVAFLVLTQWKSKDAIRAFAGADALVRRDGAALGRRGFGPRHLSRAAHTWQELKMSRAFVNEDAGGRDSPLRRFVLPDRDDPGYDEAAALALLEGAAEGDTESAEVATGYYWGERKLRPYVERALERAREARDEAAIRAAERFLR